MGVALDMVLLYRKPIAQPQLMMSCHKESRRGDLSKQAHGLMFLLDAPTRMETLALETIGLPIGVQERVLMMGTMCPCARRLPYRLQYRCRCPLLSIVWASGKRDG